VIESHCMGGGPSTPERDESGNVIGAYAHFREFGKEFDEYVRLSWRSSAEWVMETQSQLMKWLFTLQGAGIAGSLGFAYSRGVRPALIVSLSAFVLGIVCLLLWGMLMYYFATWRFTALRNDVAKVDAGELTHEGFLAEQKKRFAPLRSCEVIAWVSGVLGLVGLASLIIAVL
jgi:hypothetical protein